MSERTRHLGTRDLIRLAGFHARRLARTRTGRALPTYRDVAEKHWVLAPAESASVPAAIFLEGQLDRIIDDPRYRAPDHILRHHVERATRLKVEHGATVAYQLKDAWILDGSVWKGAARELMVPLSRIPAGKPALEEAPRGALACTLYGNSFWGHWLIDDVILHRAAAELAPPLTLPRPPYPHEQGYAKALALSCRAIGRGRVGELIMIDDRGKNSYRTRRYEATRGALAAAIPATTRPRLFLRRGTLGAANRKLINEAAVEAFLAARGFHALTPESMGADEVLRAVRGAEVIVSVEGSACAHAVHALSPRGTLVVLQPPYRFVTNHKDELDCIGANYAFVVGVPEADGFSVPTDDLGRTLDLVDRRVRPA